ncbi:MAG TPA: hypothetical protein VH020_09235 [Stellaceae bacterium]|jgi:hypothetical protein|nr:hypothetical protein [Stellaceae bacterium]
MAEHNEIVAAILTIASVGDGSPTGGSSARVVAARYLEILAVLGGTSEVKKPPERQ